MMVQENGAQRPAPVRDMSAHAAAAPPDLNLKTRCKNIFKVDFFSYLYDYYFFSQHYIEFSSLTLLANLPLLFFLS
jgi:hypothetical protein